MGGPTEDQTTTKDPVTTRDNLTIQDQTITKATETLTIGDKHQWLELVWPGLVGMQQDKIMEAILMASKLMEQEHQAMEPTLEQVSMEEWENMILGKRDFLKKPLD